MRGGGFRDVSTWCKDAHGASINHVDIEGRGFPKNSWNSTWGENVKTKNAQMVYGRAIALGGGYFVPQAAPCVMTSRAKRGEADPLRINMGNSRNFARQFSTHICDSISDPLPYYVVYRRFLSTWWGAGRAARSAARSPLHIHGCLFPILSKVI